MILSMPVCGSNPKSLIPKEMLCLRKNTFSIIFCHSKISVISKNQSTFYDIIFLRKIMFRTFRTCASELFESYSALLNLPVNALQNTPRLFHTAI